MAVDKVRQQVEMEVDEASKNLDRVIGKVETMSDETKKASKTTDELKENWNKTKKSTDAAASSIGDVRKQYEKAEAEARKLTKIIQEQERITAEFKAELAQVETQLGKINNFAKRSALLDQQRKLKSAIRENVADLRLLKIDRRQAQETANNLKKMRRGLRDTAKEGKGLNEVFGKIGAIAGIGIGIDQVVRLGKAVNQLAAEMQQGARKAEIVFGDSLPKVTAAAEESAIAIGLTRSEFTGAAAGVQDILVPLGFARDRAADLSIETTKLAGAISVWSAGQYSAEESTKILQKALTGETERLKSLGIVVDQRSKAHKDRVKNLMEERGMTLQQAKALDILEQITQKTADAQKNLGEASEDIAVQQAVANAKLRESQELFAQELTPAILALTSVYGDLTEVATTYVRTLFDAEDAAGRIATRLSTLNEQSSWWERAVVGFEAYLSRYDILEQAEEKALQRQDKIDRLYDGRINLTDDQIVKEKGWNNELEDRIELLNIEKARLESTFAERDKVTDVDVRLLYLQGQITLAQRDELLTVEGTVEERRKLLDEMAKANKANQQGKKLTEDELKLLRQKKKQIIELAKLKKLLEQGTIRDVLQAELDSIKRVREERSDKKVDIKVRLEEEKRIQELNEKIIASDLKVAEAKRAAKQSQIELLSSIENKTPEIELQIVKAKLELIDLDRAVDKLFIKWATGQSSNFAINPNLAEDENFGDGIGETQEKVEEQAVGMNERLGVTYESIAERAVQIYKEMADAGITSQQAYEMAVKESENRIIQSRAASAAAALYTVGNVFGQIASLMGDSAENSKELALFEILTNTASGIAQAVAAGAGAGPPPANILAIAAGVSAVLSGISQAKQVLSSSVQPSFNIQGFATGTASVPLGNNRPGKDTVLAKLTAGEGVVDVSANRKYPGLTQAMLDHNVDNWVNRNYMLDVLGGSVSIDPKVEVNNNFNDRNLLRQLKRNNELTKETHKQLVLMNKRRTFKRPG